MIKEKKGLLSYGEVMIREKLGNTTARFNR